MSDATNHPSEERTFLMIKPDGVMRGLVGEILRRLESRGLKIIALQMEMPGLAPGIRACHARVILFHYIPAPMDLARVALATFTF